MKKKILIIAHFCDYGFEKTNNRFNYLANLLVEEGFEVEIVTSSFCHRDKKQRVFLKSSINQCKFTLISEPTYRKNISLKRMFFCHSVFANNLAKYIKKHEKVDLIYCAIPSLQVAKISAMYAKKKSVPFIIDVQDLWPEAFEMLFDYPLMNKIVFKPFKMIADNIYKQADGIVAVSETYLNRALKVNKKCSEGESVYLGTDATKFDNISKTSFVLEKKNNEVWMTYIGTLGHSYDLMSVLEAMFELKCLNKCQNLKFIVMGDGPLRIKFEEYVKKNELNVAFTGMLAYEKLVSMLSICDFAINPITKGAAQSIINKVGDYAMAGLAVISTQECGEYSDLVNNYNIGVNCTNGNIEQIIDAIDMFYSNPELCKKFGDHNRMLAEVKFDRRVTYNKIIKIIQENIYNENKGAGYED